MCIIKIRVAQDFAKCQIKSDILFQLVVLLIVEYFTQFVNIYYQNFAQ
nr:MAG TPA: hypothetical protein [Caudoviricetes sp.]